MSNNEEQTGAEEKKDMQGAAPSTPSTPQEQTEDNTKEPAVEPDAMGADGSTEVDTTQKANTASPAHWAGAAAAVLVVAVGVGFATGWLSLPGDNGSSGETVATVNGETITQEELDTRTAQQSAIAQQQGGQAQGQEAVLEQMIDQKLLLQDAQERGIEVDEETIEEEVQGLADQLGGDTALSQALQQQDITQEELRSNLRDQLVLQQYQDAVAEERGIEATEQEVQQLYEEVSAGQQNLPALEQVREQVEAQVVQQKLQAALQEIVTTLRESADIEISL